MASVAPRPADLELAVQVAELVKRYPKSPTVAVDGLSFAVRRAEIFGLLGPNGAGKTTTVGVLTTRVVPTGGTARVAGLDVVRDAVAVRAKLGVVPQRVNLDRSLSTRNNLVFHGAYHGLPRADRNARADELLERMGLADKAKVSVDKLSGGQSQRLMIARALMHRPEVLFLDEPSTGLDPQARLFVHDRVRALRDEGVTVVLTTHDMDEAAKLSDRVGIVDHGRMLALDTPAALVRSLPGSATLEISARLAATSVATLVAALAELAGVERVEQLGEADPRGGVAGAAAESDVLSGDAAVEHVLDRAVPHRGSPPDVSSTDPMTAGTAIASELSAAALDAAGARIRSDAGAGAGVRPTTGAGTTPSAAGAANADAGAPGDAGVTGVGTDAGGAAETAAGASAGVARDLGAEAGVGTEADAGAERGANAAAGPRVDSPAHVAIAVERSSSPPIAHSRSAADETRGGVYVGTSAGPVTRERVARLRIYVTGDPAAYVAPVVSTLAARAASVAELSIGEPSLEDVFIHLTGRDLR